MTENTKERHFYFLDPTMLIKKKKEKTKCYQQWIMGKTEFNIHKTKAYLFALRKPE